MKFKVGDKVRCVGESTGRRRSENLDYAGAGWKKDKEFVVHHRSVGSVGRPVYFPSVNSSGVFESHLELADQPSSGMQDLIDRMTALVLKHTRKGHSDKYSFNGRIVGFYVDEYHHYFTVDLSSKGLEYKMAYHVSIGLPEEGNPEFGNTILDTAEWIVSNQEGG